ncbi:hypothetical protein Sjap_015593 [Stephania japonica]|uniref:WD repeat-containing protein 44 n=1 Tax=Stephania japonica TaxID=461633 RepID=A0AAP0IJE4_9MAGN
MADKRMTMMMEWDGLGDDEFFESRDRISSALSMDLLPSSESDEDEDYDDNRMSFASAVSSGPREEFRSFHATPSPPMDYNMWMSEPGSIEDRRKRLLQGMGLTGENQGIGVHEEPEKLPPSKDTKPEPPNLASPLSPDLISRSKSEGRMIAKFANTKWRKEQLVGASSFVNHLLTRSSSEPPSFRDQHIQLCASFMNPNRISSAGQLLESGAEGPFLIKSLDTGKEFLIKDCNNAVPGSLSDLQTGEMLTMEEFEKFVGHSPIVMELMRRESIALGPNYRIDKSKMSQGKNIRSSKKKGVNWLKNIRVMANSINGLISDKHVEDNLTGAQTHASPPPPSSKWIKVHQRGKSYKELSGLYMCQEIQAHEGSIWCIRFSLDARYLATAGEDKIIHVWEVVDCDVLSSRPVDEAHSMPVHPMSNASPENPISDAQGTSLEKKKKGKNSSTVIPDYVYVPETVFSLTEKPICSFEGHLDDVLDLSWSKSQQLLSSSMDKTVRLWDMETKTCLRLFAHNDYVTCIQFNPVDDRYFISGSLDAKVRLWSIPDRQVVDWTELHEMVTALCYTPDGQGALVGSHKGSCRLYDISDFKLDQKEQIHIQSKKKSQAKKITGFQYVPVTSSEVLITSADSRIRIFNGSSVTHKFTGFRNTNSQIPASFTADGKYVVCASEDSEVYIWKRRSVDSAKHKSTITTRSREHFHCKDVSVAVPWPGSLKYEPPLWQIQPKRNSKRSNPLPPLAPSAPTSADTAVKNTEAKNLPPLPPKANLDRSGSYQEDDPALVSASNSSLGSSSFSTAIDFSFGDSAAISASDKSSATLSSIFENQNGNGNTTMQAAAWGMVIVAAGLGGEIRVYQNFGLPVISRQTFRDYASPGSIGRVANRYFHGS